MFNAKLGGNTRTENWEGRRGFYSLVVVAQGRVFPIFRKNLKALLRDLIKHKEYTRCYHFNIVVDF
jgi:hypothetical protein